MDQAIALYSLAREARGALDAYLARALARAGDWRDLSMMRTSYRQADAVTTLRVIEHGTGAPAEGAGGASELGIAARHTQRKPSGGKSGYDSGLRGRQISQLDSTAPSAARGSACPSSVIRRSVHRTRPRRRSSSA